MFLSLLLLPHSPGLAEQNHSEFDANDFALVNIEFTVLHEMGHVLIDEFYVPVLGKEEDIADRIGIIATYLIHASLDEPDFATGMASILANWQMEWEIASDNNLQPAYWDQHPLEIQRYFDIVCLLFGSDPDHLEEFREATGLPHERAIYCEKEYQQARRGLTWLATTFGNPENIGGKPLRGVIGVQYQRSFSPNGDKINSLLKESGMLEKIAQRVSAVYRLPRDITINVTGCGSDDAYWNPVSGQIVICHELVNSFIERGKIWEKREARTMPFFPQIPLQASDTFHRHPVREETAEQ